MIIQTVIPKYHVFTCKMSVLLIFLLLSACSPPDSSTFKDMTVAAYSVEDLIVTNDLRTLDESEQRPQTEFEATERINAVVVTSGDDAGVMGIKWYYDDILIHEQFGKTNNNQFVSFIQGSPLTPLVSGNYRVEATVIAGGTLITRTFKVKDYEIVLDVNPLLPTPIGHINIENAPYANVPFAFDEVWEIENTDWIINEVKIAFFIDRVFFNVIVESEILPDRISKEEATEIARPIAEYAIQNGYLQTAREIEVNGKKHEFTDPITITLFNKEFGGGYRVLFDLEELK